MVTLERRSRKGPVLTPSSLPCLGDMPTINITEGCAHGCTYCYIRGYSSYPGDGRVVIENMPELVRTELARKRQRPRRVYFSPSSDAFQPLAEVQAVTYETMAAILEAGIEVDFLTKGLIGDQFFPLFARFSSRVFAQIGITTLDERLWQAFEPGAASPSQRLGNIDNLARVGIEAAARLDPLIPGITDTDAGLACLLADLERRKVRHAAASYLFLRPAFAARLAEQVRNLREPGTSAVKWNWRSMAAGIGGGQMMDVRQRQESFSRLETLAARFHISIHVCRCKNPDLAESGCQIAGPTSDVPQAPPLPLFDTGGQ